MFWIHFQKESSKKFTWASRLWVGRRKEPILIGLCPEKTMKKEFRQWRKKSQSYYILIKHWAYKTSLWNFYILNEFSLFLNMNIFYKSSSCCSPYKPSYSKERPVGPYGTPCSLAPRRGNHGLNLNSSLPPSMTSQTEVTFEAFSDYSLHFFLAKLLNK